ncbi:MAG: hypothetical protein ACE5FG_02330 [Myxococcota bacterium]
MAGDRVTIGRFTSAIEAELARTRLRVEGIPAFLERDHSTGEVELSVPSVAAHDALAILSAPADEAPPTAGGPSMEGRRLPDGEERCLICQSSYVQLQPPAWPWRLLRSLLRTVLPLPANLFSKRRCGVCGHRWTGSETPGAPAPPSV